MAAARETLEGLRDVLGLTLTRVIDGDINTLEARRLLGHLTKELNAIDRHAGAPAPRAKRKRAVRSKRQATGR